MAPVIELCDPTKEKAMNIRTPFSSVGRYATFEAAGLVLTCALLAACQSRSGPAQNQTTVGSLPGSTANSLQGMEPAAPFDETPITPYETVGAPVMN